jgi:hypothetical protein
MMSKLTPQERLDLNKLLKQSDAEDNTEYIRKIKHSVKMRDDIRKLDTLKQKGPIDKTNAQYCAPFLFENYPDIFNKIIDDELDLEIMTRLLIILKLIEDEKVDQHEASVLVGKLLKKLYVDSALKKCKKLDDLQDENTTENIVEYAEEKQISWREWRNTIS